MARPDDRTEGTPQHVSSLEEGTLLRDRFRVTDVLGRGGFGITYLAVDEVLEMAVAVKEYVPVQLAFRPPDSDTVRPSSGSQVEEFDRGLQRFLEEARRLATFEHHPNIVRVRTFFKENGTSYLVMNYYEGQTLGEYLRKRNGVLPEAEGLRIVHEVLDGLSAVHENDVLHRDVDPENLYLTDTGKVVLLDFGTARTVVAEHSESLSVILKRGYAPIEQYQNQTRQGPWTDVYATAATLYRTLTGYKPPEASARVLDDELLAPKTLVPSLSTATQEALLAGLVLDPDERLSSASAFADRLPAPAAVEERGGREDGVSPRSVRAEAPTEGGATSADTTTLRVSTSHACRLYAEGDLVATLTPTEEQVLALTDAPHHLRAVRLGKTQTAETELQDEGTTAPANEPGRGPASIWEGTVGGDGRPGGEVQIDFDEERSSAVSTSSDAPPSATLRVRTDAPCRLLVDGTDVGRADPDAPASVPVEPGTYQLRAEAVAQTAAWEQTVEVEQGMEAEMDVTFAGTEPRRPRPVQGGRWPLVVATLSFVMIVLGGLVWVWLGNQAPNPESDRLMLSEAGILRPLANDYDPEQEPLSLQSVGTLPDSVGTATLLDSARIRVQLVDGFAGTVRTHYTVADAQGRTAQAKITLQAPFWRRPRSITRTLPNPQTVRVAAMHGNTASDVIVASTSPEGGTVSVFRNRHTVAEPFAPPTPATTIAGEELRVATGRITDDEAPDVVVAAERGHLVWHENRADGYGEPHVIDEDTGPLMTVQTADLDGDGDADVVVGRQSTGRVVWYENKDSGRFGPPRPITTGVAAVNAVHLAPLSAGERPDVIVATTRGRVVWYENRPAGGTDARFQIRHQLSTGIDEPVEVHAADLTNDGERDVLVSSAGRDALLWFENRTQDTGSPSFEPKRTVARNTENVEAIVTADLDGDGRQDVLGRSATDNAILYCANRGEGHFGQVQTITTTLQNVQSIRMADVNHDGRPDVVAASPAENLVAWYPNYLSK